MIDLELELVSENPSWIAVLKAYQQAQEELAAQQAEAAAKSSQTEKPDTTSDQDSDAETAPNDTDKAVLDTSADGSEPSDGFKKRASRWVQRITKLPGIEVDELSRIHGRLIAYDLLKCDLAGRSDGMVYQLTTTGKSILSRFNNEVTKSEDRSAA